MKGMNNNDGMTNSGSDHGGHIKLPQEADRPDPGKIGPSSLIFPGWLLTE